MKSSGELLSSGRLCKIKGTITAEANGLADCYTLSKQANYLCTVSLSAMLVFRIFFFYPAGDSFPSLLSRWDPGATSASGTKSQCRWRFGSSWMLTRASVCTTRHFPLDCSLFITREALSHLPSHRPCVLSPAARPPFIRPSKGNVFSDGIAGRAEAQLGAQREGLRRCGRRRCVGVSVCRWVGGTRGRVEKERGKKTDA